MHEAENRWSDPLGAVLSAMVYPHHPAYKRGHVFHELLCCEFALVGTIHREQRSGTAECDNVTLSNIRTRLQHNVESY